MPNVQLSIDQIAVLTILTRDAYDKARKHSRESRELGRADLAEQYINLAKEHEVILAILKNPL